MKVVALCLIALFAVACASQMLSTDARTQAVSDCEAAILAALPSVLGVIDSTSATNLQKATETDAALRQANALPACTKVGTNALTVIREQRAARKASGK